MMLLSSILTRIFLDGRTVGLEDEGISQYNFAQSPQGAFCLPPARMVQFTKFMASRVSFYVCSIFIRSNGDWPFLLCYFLSTISRSF